MSAPHHKPQDEVWCELWLSLASLLRSYTAAHGLSGNRQATVAASDQIIVARHDRKWLRLERVHASITWTRENGHSGTAELTDHGHLRGPAGEQALDLAAEAWAHELMLEQKTDAAKRVPELKR